MMYIAPEVHRGEHFDERSDVYSFSIVMWEMVTNKVLICCLCIVFQVRLFLICGRGQKVYECLPIFLERPALHISCRLHSQTSLWHQFQE
jgi:hypothetical protein